MSPRPWKAPPTCTVPPPVAPLASSAAVDPRCTWSPSTWIVPPVAPVRRRGVPLTSTVPPSASRRIRPFCSTAVSAWIVPLMLIRWSRTVLALRAVISTVCPPLVSIRPVLVMRLVTGSPCASRSCPTCASLNARLISASPYRSTVKVSAEPSTTLPSRARISPSLRTCGATSATSPPSRAVSVPALRMPAPARPG